MHLLRSITHPLNFGDEVTVVLRAEPGVVIRIELDPELEKHLRLHALAERVVADLSSPSNLAIRAAEALLGESRIRGGVEITLRKSIPLEAGLGGGSADAAATLLELNRQIACPVTAADLQSIAAGLGSDVPQALIGGPALLRGIGTSIVPLERIPESALLRQSAILIVKPAGGVSTPAAYRELGHEPRLSEEALDLESRASFSGMEQYLREFGFVGESESGSTSVGQEGIGPRSWETLRACLTNDFQAAAERINSEIASVSHTLLELGAWHALLAGSGSAVIGFFQDDGARRFAVSRLAELKREWFVRAARLL